MVTRKRKSSETDAPKAAAAKPPAPAPKKAPRSKPAPTAKAASTSADSFPIVGIGASAGGLAAIEEFFVALPKEESSGMAFVLLQHLDPDHKSLLLDLVKRYTDMTVDWAKNGAQVQPGHAYVLPPNKDLGLINGNLVLEEPEKPRGQRLPIDHFFRSMAADQHENAICIVLSGTGSDGTLGVRAVKGEGGMAIAQSPESAAYDGMPRNAIATGLVDYVSTPAEMPEQLLGYVCRALGQPRDAQQPAQDQPVILLQVLNLLRDRTGHDFTHYKANTLGRRIERRMAVTRIDRMEDYLALLRRDSLESDTLFRELLIGVTSFFRDAAAFETLATEVVPGLVAIRDSSHPVRVWVPGCSTGEEAYSIAMLLLEQADSTKRNVSIQVFATDIDTEAIERARAGIYPDSIGADVSPERLERFFVRDGGNYRVAKAVRDCLVFAKQDVTKDPPFSRVDLISCRNLLIYMDAVLQQKLMPLFHYALNADGYLFLGSSETVGGSADLFAPVDRKWKLFRRKGTVTPRQLLATSMPPFKAAELGTRRPSLEDVPLRVRVRDLAEQALLERHVPACVVINAEGEVLYIHGHTGRYLEPAAGEPSGSVFKMARDGLRFELTAAVRKVLARKESVLYERLRVQSDGEVSVVNLTVEPLAGPDAVKGILLVIFEDVAVADGSGAVTQAESSADREQRIADLDRELSAKEEYLRTTVEELETTNEELKSSNEEMQSSNEELQSTNEELETSREELQSVNEELITVNNELQEKVGEVSRINDDMNNMIAGTGIGTMFVDRHLLIKRFTPAVTAIMSLIPTDVGRPLGDIAPRIKGEVDIVGSASSVLDTLVPMQALVEDGAGHVFEMRAQPYRTLDNVIDGAVLTFVDVTEQHMLQAKADELSAAAAQAGALAQSVLDTALEPRLVLDGDLRVVTANRAFLAAFGLGRDDLVGHPLGDVYEGAWLTRELKQLLLGVLPGRGRVDDFQLAIDVGPHEARTLTIQAVELLQDPGLPRLIMLTVTEIRETP